MPLSLIQTERLTVYYGRQRGILDLDLSVHQGEVFGFLGPNGAGKTTTLRVLLDILRPSRGKASIFGLDCRTQGVAIRRRVGYLPGELSLYRSMTGERFLDLTASLHGHNSTAYRGELCDRLQLDAARRMREYSRGNKQKVGLVAAFMGKPDLLILDEPTSGLDPLVQKTVLDLVREARRDGRTVFFSSHNLAEVQAVCDRVGIIREGRLAATESVETLVNQHFRRIQLRFSAAPAAGAFELQGVKEIDRDENSVTLEVHANLKTILERAAMLGAVDLETHPVTLEEVFLTFYGKGTGNDAALIEF